jgi:von Willebrand factor type A domain.
MFIEGGQSAVYDGIYLAAQQLLDEAKKQPDNRFAIILVSDGADRNSYYTQKQLFSLVAGTDVQVYAIGLTRDLVDNQTPTFISNRNSTERDRAETFLRTLAAAPADGLYTRQKIYDRRCQRCCCLAHHRAALALRHRLHLDRPKAQRPKPKTPQSRSPTPQPPKTAPPPSATPSPSPRTSGPWPSIVRLFSSVTDCGIL